MGDDEEADMEEYGGAYDEEEDDEFDDDFEGEFAVPVPDLKDNAWVWQLLILSFSLGVCSCLCYYATKMRPSRGQFDFYHWKQNSAYAQVGLDEDTQDISALDEENMINQSVIDESD